MESVTAQAPADPLQTIEVYELVVTADRAAILRIQTTAPISAVGPQQLQSASGIRTLVDEVRQIPGIAMVYTDGLGYAVQPIVRGFFGGGETECLLILVDGQPLNTLESGLINWE